MTTKASLAGLSSADVAKCQAPQHFEDMPVRGCVGIPVAITGGNTSLSLAERIAASDDAPIPEASTYHGFEVCMSGRRSHPRFEIASPWGGALRVLQDVVVDRTTDEELLVVSDAPGLTGEELTLELLGGGTGVLLKVRVLESRPVIVNDRLRHRLRLAILSAEDRGDASSDPDPRALDGIAGSR